MTNVLDRHELHRLSTDWLPAPDGGTRSRPDTVLRRAVEIIACMMLMILTFPVMLCAAIAIRLGGGGPVVFRQQRTGLHGVPFMVLKFRTMGANAEADGPVWAAVDDSRITKVGAVLRKARIDELPQLFNVLRGEMALIGPRPERPHFVELLAIELPCYRDREVVKPGITGWAQVRYGYGSSVEDARRKLEFDLHYIQHRSMLLDLLILLLTVRVVLLWKGAR